MKPNIHPEYVECTVICICGNTWKTKASRKEIKIEHCNLCHPVYTGADNILVDTAGQVDKFKKRLAHAQAHQEKKLEKMAKEAAKADDAEEVKA
jgi:large subunit ribosomal protein L31